MRSYDQNNSNSTSKGFVAEFTELGLLHWATYFGESKVVIEGIDVHPSTGHLVICGSASDDLPSVQYGPPIGDQWCGLGSDLQLVHDIEFYNDTLYAMVLNHWVDGE